MDRGPLVDCPGADTLFEYVEGRAPPRARARVEGHVADCAACRRAISALAETTPSGSDAPAPDAKPGGDTPDDDGEPRPAAAEAPVPDDLAPGTEVGRYVVLGVVGRGGMGAVYAARDPALHRKVALKLLRGDVAAGRAQREIEARLRREAQAMARLAHPNVAAVYDVGQYGGRVFVAMEFVEGQTLARWFEQRGRPLRRALELFLSAGRGLAAAHAAGLVHRDFKPQNVLVGDDGRVRVVDFGLARLTPPPDTPNAPNTPDAPGGAAATSSEGPPAELASVLTRPGALLGTPLYMAPELYRGEPADARSDQFSFAVALYEALYRQRPFAGADLTTLVAQAELGRIRPVPRGAKVPREVRRVLLRGLSASPADRFPSMDALLAELERARAPLRPWLGASALVAALAIVGGALWARQGGSRQVPCEDASQHVERAWGAARREAVASALRRTGAPYADAAAREVTRVLDAYAARWAKQRVEACKAARGEPTDETARDGGPTDETARGGGPTSEAARGGGPTSEAVRGGKPTDEATALRMACLDERLHEFRALGDRLLEVDRRVAEQAAQAPHRLSDVEACAPPRSLAGPTPPPDGATRAEVEALRARLGEARALGHTGRHREGLEVARPLAERAQQLGYRPLEAEALLLVGQLAAQSGDGAAAERALERAAWAAEAGRHEGAAAQALLELLRIRGGYQAYYEQVEPLARRVEALLERLGGDHELEAQLRQTLGHSDVARGRYQAAERELERALGLLEQRHGADDPRVLPPLSELGKLATLRGRFPEATAHFERARSIARRSFGDAHPVAARALCDAASAPYVREGRPGPAAAAYGQALTALELALGPEHPALAEQLDHLALALLERGHAAEALTPSRRTASIAEKALGAAHPLLPLYLTRLAAALVGDGRPAEALPVVERALRLARERFGEEHARVAEALRVLGDVQKRLGRLPEARESLHRGHAMSVRTLGPDYAAGDALRSLGELSLRAKQPAQALEPLEGALRAYQQRDAVGPLAQTNALLARALWESDRDRARAGALAAEALERLKADARSSAESAELERWMRQHRVPFRRPDAPISDHRLPSPNEGRLRPSVAIGEQRPPQTIGYRRRTKAASDHRLPLPNEGHLKPLVTIAQRGLLIDF